MPLIFPLSPGAAYESYDSAYTLLFKWLAVVTLLCAPDDLADVMPEALGRYPNPQQWILNPLDSVVASRLPATAFLVC
ncbi:hypothetical protein MJ588_16375 [Klebsiella pneumoniae]|nr:hypothetical protein MJ588_16375 [Klebsiella pneumoniae]